jgi:hypothetical protein
MRTLRTELCGQAPVLMTTTLYGQPLYKRVVRGGGGHGRKSCNGSVSVVVKPKVEYYLPEVEELERLSRGETVPIGKPTQGRLFDEESELERIRRLKCESDRQTRKEER